MPHVYSILPTSAIMFLELPLVDQAPSMGGLYIIQDLLKSLDHPQYDRQQCAELRRGTLTMLSA